MQNLEPRGRPRPVAIVALLWPISTRVNKPENDDAAIIEPVHLTGDAA